MTPAQLRCLQRSFAQVESQADHFGSIFYERLFVLDPELRKLFRNDIKAQQSKFMKVVAEMVQLHLRALISLPVTAQASAEALLPGAFWSGKLHAAYGVRAEHFDTMQKALMWAFEQTLGNAFTPEVKEAWEHAYDMLARGLIHGMETWEREEQEAETEAEPTVRVNGDAEEDEEASAFIKNLDDRMKRTLG